MKNPQQLSEIIRIVNDVIEHEEATTEDVEASSRAMNLLIEFGYEKVRSFDADGVIVVEDFGHEEEDEETEYINKRFEKEEE